jgi:hypothetical protein
MFNAFCYFPRAIAVAKLYKLSKNIHQISKPVPVEAFEDLLKSMR